MIWLIGNKGMLGNEVEKLLKENNLSYVASDQEIDITNYNLLKRYVENKKVDWIINCASYTVVDKAEEQIKKTYRLNRDGVGNLARIALDKQTKLIHISTDYVFDGKKDKTCAYTEEDKPNPMSIYGKSKLGGEKEIKNVLNEFFIIRTTWLYGLNGSNFVYTMLRLFKERAVIKVVNDQWGSPTYTTDLAGAILKIIEDNSISYGVYHFTNEGMTNWYEFARTIYTKAKRLGLIEDNKKVEIQPIKTEDYPTAARRPRYSVLSKGKIEKEFNLKIRDWNEALEDFLVSLKENKIENI